MKIKMIETTIFEGVRYEKGKKYNVAKEKAQALGSSAVILEEEKKEKTKIVDDAKNAMISDEEGKKKSE